MTSPDWLLAAVNVTAAIWVGAIIFQSMAVAPVVFRSLDEGAARVFLRAIFPRLFKLGLGCGVVMILATSLAGVLSGNQQPVIDSRVAEQLQLEISAMKEQILATS